MAGSGEIEGGCYYEGAVGPAVALEAGPLWDEAARERLWGGSEWMVQLNSTYLAAVRAD